MTNKQFKLKVYWKLTLLVLDAIAAAFAVASLIEEFCEDVEEEEEEDGSQ